MIGLLITALTFCLESQSRIQTAAERESDARKTIKAAHSLYDRALRDSDPAALRTFYETYLSQSYIHKDGRGRVETQEQVATKASSLTREQMRFQVREILKQETKTVSFRFFGFKAVVEVVEECKFVAFDPNSGSMPPGEAQALGADILTTQRTRRLETWLRTRNDWKLDF